MENASNTGEKGGFFGRFLWEKWHDVPVFTLTTLTPSHLPSHLKRRYTIDYKKCEGVRVENKIRMRGSEAKFTKSSTEGCLDSASLRIDLPDEPLAPGQQRQELGGEGTAEEGEDGDAGDGQPDGQQGMGDIAGYEEGGQVAQEEKVHEVHTEGELGELRDPTGCLALRDAAEEQEGAEGA